MRIDVDLLHNAARPKIIAAATFAERVVPAVMSNRLTAIAAEIQAAHRNVQAGAEQVAHHAIAAGQLLVEAKGTLPHGAWEPWLAEHARMSTRTARRYMQLARSGLKPATVAGLGIKGAADLLAARNKADEFDPDNSCGWPMPPRGGIVHVRGEDGKQAFIWNAPAQPDDRRFYDFLSTGRDFTGPSAFASRAMAARGVAWALAHDGFVECKCLVDVLAHSPESLGFPNLLDELTGAADEREASPVEASL